MEKILFTLISISILLTGCYLPFIDPPYNGPYYGKIIDEATGEPIEGVVILSTWHKIYPNPAGHSTKFYDARETVTDKNGEFTILGGRILIFKAGYTYLWNVSWTRLKEISYKVEDEKVIFRLKKLTMEQRKRQGTPDFYIGERYDEKENITHSCLPKNIKLLPKEVNKELLEQGLKPYDLEEGRCEK